MTLTRVVLKQGYSENIKVNTTAAEALAPSGASYDTGNIGCTGFGPVLWKKIRIEPAPI